MEPAAASVVSPASSSRALPLPASHRVPPPDPYRAWRVAPHLEVFRQRGYPVVRYDAPGTGTSCASSPRRHVAFAPRPIGMIRDSSLGACAPRAVEATPLTSPRHDDFMTPRTFRTRDTIMGLPHDVARSRQLQLSAPVQSPGTSRRRPPSISRPSSASPRRQTTASIRPTSAPVVRRGAWVVSGEAYLATPEHRRL